MTKRTKPTLAQTVSNQLIEMLEKGTAPWQRPWELTHLSTHHNATTEKAYRGFNQLILSMSDFQDPRWMTFKQAQEKGCQIKKGSKGTHLQYWLTEKEIIKKDDQGKVIKDDKGNPIKTRIKLDYPRPVSFVVFNAEQMDGIEPLTSKFNQPEEWKLVDRAESILKNSQAQIIHKEQNKAYYSPSEDHIILPVHSQFKNQEMYYSTALHELGHWTGHESRLNRDLIHPFGSVGYAKEELRAEIASMMLGQELGIRHDPEPHAAYVKSWIQVLKNDPNEIIRASKDAQQIFEHVMEFDRQISKEIKPSKPIMKNKDIELEM